MAGGPGGEEGEGGGRRGSITIQLDIFKLNTELFMIFINYYWACTQWIRCPCRCSGETVPVPVKKELKEHTTLPDTPVAILGTYYRYPWRISTGINGTN